MVFKFWFLVDFFWHAQFGDLKKIVLFPKPCATRLAHRIWAVFPSRDLLVSLLTASSSKVPQKALSAPPVCGAQRKPCQWEIQILKMETEQAADFETRKNNQQILKIKRRISRF